MHSKKKTGGKYCENFPCCHFVNEYEHLGFILDVFISVLLCVCPKGGGSNSRLRIVAFFEKKRQQTETNTKTLQLKQMILKKNQSINQTNEQSSSKNKLEQMRGKKKSKGNKSKL